MIMITMDMRKGMMLVITVVGLPIVILKMIPANYGTPHDEVCPFLSSAPLIRVGVAREQSAYTNEDYEEGDEEEQEEEFPEEEEDAGDAQYEEETPEGGSVDDSAYNYTNYGSVQRQPPPRAVSMSVNASTIGIPSPHKSTMRRIAQAIQPVDPTYLKDYGPVPAGFRPSTLSAVLEAGLYDVG